MPISEALRGLRTDWQKAYGAQRLGSFLRLQHRLGQLRHAGQGLPACDPPLGTALAVAAGACAMLVFAANAPSSPLSSRPRACASG